jgi:putative ABC transport system permease protein
MNLSAAFRIALEALFVNKGRSALTSLGIVIGIMAVIAMVAAGGGAREKLDERLDSVGKNLILIRPGGQTTTGLVLQVVPLTSEDAQALRDDRELQRMLVGVAESQPMPVTAHSAYATRRTTAVGLRPELFKIRNWQLARMSGGGGRFFTDSDIKKAANVCMLGDTIRRRLFPNKQNPIGERIRIENVSLEVIGVLEPKGANPLGQDQDDQVFVPMTTLQNKIAMDQRIAIIVASVKNQAYLDDAVARIRKIMRKQHRLRPDQPDDFDVKSVQEMAQIGVFLIDTLNVLVVVIASISLLVGGIGIMNIMLVSVTERTREIGIRMAVGATPANVRNQFLLEAMILSLVGGVLGVSLGIGVAALITHWLDWPMAVSPFYVALAFGVSALVGVFFGYYPAAKASRLDPIEALRYE